MKDTLTLSTLHRLHEAVDFYTYDGLSEIIKGFSPDIRAVELTPADLANRKVQWTEREYQHSVYPLLDQLHCEAVALEPSEPKYSELVQLARKAAEDMEARNPSTLEQFGLYVNALYDVLLR